MARHFNTAGPCKADLHYMLPAEQRLPEVTVLIEAQAYFVLHAARQVGKSTAVTALANRLTEEGRYTAVVLSMETGVSFPHDVGAAELAILDAWRRRIEAVLPPELHPPAWPKADSGARIGSALSTWAMWSPRPLVVFLDEIDALRDSVLEGILRQLRDGHSNRPTGFPWSLALVGMRDVRDYKMVSGGEDRSHSASPFNVMTDSLTMGNFSHDDVCNLLLQHTQDTGQQFLPAALAKVFELSQGHPWLVNALARQCVEVLVKGRTLPITVQHVEQAKEILLQRQDTHFDSLAERLREPRVRSIIEPMLLGTTLPNVAPDDIRFVLDLGLLVERNGGLDVANPIYREFIVRALSFPLRVSVPALQPVWLRADGSLDWDKLRESFVAFWLRHGEMMQSAAPYSEAAAHLVTFAYLYRVCNGSGTVEREYAIGADRLDMYIDWKGDKLAIEIKTWRDSDKNRDPAEEGLLQLDEYMGRIGVNKGWLLFFNQRKKAPPLEKRVAQIPRVTASGRHVMLIRL